MKFFWYNFIPVLLIALAAELIYLNRDGWGWCVFASILIAVYPSSSKTEDSDVEEDEDEEDEKSSKQIY